MTAPAKTGRPRSTGRSRESGGKRRELMFSAAEWAIVERGSPADPKAFGAWAIDTLVAAAARNTPAPPDEFAGLVLMFDTAARGATAGKLHRKGCQFTNVATGRMGARWTITETDIADQIADLTERGFKVARCKCCPQRKETP